MANILLEVGDIDGACNRAYCAMFDAARAALIASDAPMADSLGKTHSGLMTAFALHLVKHGPVPKEFERMLKHAEQMRLIADYLEKDCVALERILAWLRNNRQPTIKKEAMSASFHGSNRSRNTISPGEMICRVSSIR